MQREIKFRAWHKEKGMITNPTSMGTIVARFIREFCPSPTGFGSRAEEVSPEEYILMQYTGLKDKNGKEIYERDIVKAQGEVRQVVWKDFGWCTASLKTNSYYSLCENEKYTVIGNVYENPDLLK